MQVGTEILLARMKEYPEEFLIDEGSLIGRWHRVMRDARNYLPEEDLKAIDEGMRQVHIDKFNEQVLKVLAGEDTPEKETVVYKGQGPTQQAYEQQMMKRQMVAMQAQNNAMNGLYTGANGVSIGDWLTGGNK
jgi:hypothetical protein